MSESSTLRRTPRQARGQQRIALILDAAAQVFAELGYETATTNAIAARANTSIGSLYQFFPNKEAILHALAARYLEQLRELYDRVLTVDVAALPLERLLDCIIDPLVEFKAGQPGFAVISSGAHSSRELAATAEELNQAVIQRVDAIFAARAPALPAAQRQLCATFSVAVAGALLPLAEAADGSTRALLLAETKALLAAYLAQRL